MNNPTKKLAPIALAIALATVPASAALAKTYPKVGANHDRTVELVSTATTTAAILGGALSTDGEHAIYKLDSGADLGSVGTQPAMISTRTATGWQVKSALPPRSRIGILDAQIYAVAPDLSSLIYVTQGPLVSDKPKTFWRYEPATGALTRAATVASPATLNLANVTSDDMRHVAGTTNVPMVAADTSTVGGLYELGGPEPELLSRLPDGSAASCGVDYYAAEFVVLGFNAQSSQHWMSADGNRVFFHTRGNDCASTAELYMREGGPGSGGVTRLISGPAVSGPALGARFTQASRDGSQVYYSTATKLDPADQNTGVDVYRYTVGVGNKCLTCVVPDANVATSGPPPAGGRERILVSQSGERMYFVSKSALAAGAVDGAQNLYVWRRGVPDRIEFVAPTNLFITTGDATTAIATDDGSVLVFSATDPGLDALSGGNSGGLRQYYRYDDRDGTLVCMSCSPGGSGGVAPEELSIGSAIGAIDGSRFLSQDGRTFVFTTGSALAANDVNQVLDVYEWRDGKVGLLTDGVSSSGYHIINQVSDDGHDVLFSSFSALSPDSRDESLQLYDARIGDGFPAVHRPVCEGDSCQGSATHRRADSEPSTVGLREGESLSVPRTSLSVRSLTRAQRSALAAGRSVALTVRVGKAGTVEASARARLGRATRTVAKAVTRAKAAGTVRVAVRLSRAARRELARTGRLRVSVSVRMTGAVEPRTMDLDLRRAK